ncbi:MAG: metal-dependent transcriptional regulator [Clostridia bacterium]|nr:metal-dependent transcriptional regulator [Clostridia bacterium]
MAKILESGEMYLENILVLREKQGQVRSIDIVNYTGYSKPSISRAIGVLRRDGMINVDSDGYITLTEEGEARAQKIYERHRVLTEFFEMIGVSHETASADACKVEHHISDETFEKMKEHARRAGQH